MRLDRIFGCFKGLATGDAIGKQTETLARSGVLRWHPAGITGFEGRPGDIIPRYVGNRWREWRIGETTDDTEQTIAVARAILREGKVCHEAVGKELLQCRKSVHPGVSMWTFQQIGDPARVASGGDGCGAAMRVAPVAVLHGSDRLDELIHGACESAVPTHGGPLAISAAAAVAITISAALDGKPAAEVLRHAVEAARRAGGSTIASSIESIHADLSRRGGLNADEIAAQYFPNRPENIVPLAIALALITESAEATILLAANVGGDADSVASIGGAIAGALRPETVNQDWFDVVESANGDGLLEIAAALATLSCATASRPDTGAARRSC
jgi:ADP-ribosylglycohydrolase